MHVMLMFDEFNNLGKCVPKLCVAIVPCNLLGRYLAYSARFVNSFIITAGAMWES